MPTTYFLQGNCIDRADTALCIGNGQANQSADEIAGALNCMHDQQAVAIPTYCGTDDYLAEATEEMANTLKAVAYKSPPYCNVGYAVRRLTPLECERLQGYPQKEKLDLSKMTKDEYIAWNIVAGNIVVDADKGKVFATRGPGGIALEKPREMSGSDNNGYLVVSIRNGTTKMSCRVHRIIWISQNGVIPEGFVVDHINSNKKDNRICNLQLLTTAENSLKAKEDGLYCSGEDNKATKLSPDLWDEIAYLYEFSDMTIRELADTYGVSKSRINQIIRLDGWTDIGDWTDSKGKVHKPSDSARYKALGNSIALPPWKWVLLRITAQYERPATLGSLFDGIGGFPLIWERLNGDGTCLWASEIEEFCIAVTRLRFERTVMV